MMTMLQRRCRNDSAPRAQCARIWAPLARFIEAEARIGAWAGATPRHPRALRVRPLRHQAGLGLPVRRADAGAADRHAPVLSQGRLARPLRFPGHRRRRHPGRHARLQARDLGGGQGHPHLPCGRHGHGDLQDLGRLLDLSRSLASCASAACRCSPASCMPPSAPTSRAPGGCSTSASRIIRRCGRSCCWPSASTSTSSRTTTCSTRASLLFALTALLFGRCWVHFKVWQRAPAHAAAGRLRAGGAVHLVCREHRHLHRRLDVSQPAPRLDAGVVRQARRLVPADDHQLRAGGAGEPAAGDGGGGGGAQGSGAGAAPRFPIAPVS